MGAFAALLFTAVTSAAMGYVAHLFGLAHFHLIGGIPLVEVVRYLQLLVQQGGAAFVEQLPGRVQIPIAVRFWIGGVRLVVEVVGAVVATGWMLSLATDVPFCWKNRRFFELR